MFMLRSAMALVSFWSLVLPDLQPSGELGCKECPEKRALELTWQSQYVKATAASCDLSHLKACSAGPIASMAEGTL